MAVRRQATRLKGGPTDCYGSGASAIYIHPEVLPREWSLAANAEALQKCLIALRVRIAQVGQKPATLRDHGQQSLA